MNILENIMEAIKYVLFFGLQSVVFALIAVTFTLIAGLDQFIRDRVEAVQNKLSRRRSSVADNKPVEQR